MSHKTTHEGPRERICRRNDFWESEKIIFARFFERETRENGSEGAVLEVLAIFGKYVSYSAIKSKN